MHVMHIIPICYKNRDSLLSPCIKNTNAKESNTKMEKNET